MNKQPVALVTGATGAIGRAIAQSLAEKDYRVVLVCRNKRLADETTSQIRFSTGNSSVSYELVDVSVPSSIKDLAERWQGPLNVLINNAAVVPQTRTLSLEGLELQFATNILGYFRMSMAFFDILRTQKSARVVNVASYWAGDLDMEDLQFVKRSYNKGIAYRQSKQANRMLSKAFSMHWKSNSIDVNSCHPGDVNSKLSNDLGFGGSDTPDQGAETPVWLASSPELEGVSGSYFENRRPVVCPFSSKAAEVEALFQYCLNFC